MHTFNSKNTISLKDTINIIGTRKKDITSVIIVDASVDIEHPEALRRSLYHLMSLVEDGFVDKLYMHRSLGKMHDYIGQHAPDKYAYFDEAHRIRLKDSQLVVSTNSSLNFSDNALLLLATDTIDDVSYRIQHPLVEGLFCNVDSFMEFSSLLSVGVRKVAVSSGSRLPNIQTSTQRIERPWGIIEHIGDHLRVSCRVLHVQAGKRLSLQKHYCRDEQFIAIDDGVLLDIGGSSKDGGLLDEIRTYTFKSGEGMLVRRDQWHRLRAPENSNVKVLEIAYGVYDQEHDIERAEDDYGRTRLNGAQ